MVEAATRHLSGYVYCGLLLSGASAKRQTFMAAMIPGIEPMPTRTCLAPLLHIKRVHYDKIRLPNNCN